MNSEKASAQSRRTFLKKSSLMAAAGAAAPWALLLEARTIHDTLYGVGTNVGPHEFKTDHYRRFIDPDVFLADMASRFSVRYFEVAQGFAPFGDQDPVLMRAAIQRRES